MAKTAAELMAELNNDPEYQKRIKEEDEARAEYWRTHGLDRIELLSDLKEAGFELESVWDFVNRKNDYAEAIPVLIKHLKIKHHPRVLEGVVRSLAIRDLSSDTELWDTLVELYESTPSDESITEPCERGLQQGVAVALDVLATEDRIGDLEMLVQKYPKGDAMQFLWLAPRNLIHAL